MPVSNIVQVWADQTAQTWDFPDSWNFPRSEPASQPSQPRLARLGIFRILGFFPKSGTTSQPGLPRLARLGISQICRFFQVWSSEPAYTAQTVQTWDFPDFWIFRIFPKFEPAEPASPPRTAQTWDFPDSWNFLLSLGQPASPDCPASSDLGFSRFLDFLKSEPASQPRLPRLGIFRIRGIFSSLGQPASQPRLPSQLRLGISQISGFFPSLSLPASSDLGYATPPMVGPTFRILIFSGLCPKSPEILFLSFSHPILSASTRFSGFSEIS